MKKSRKSLVLFIITIIGMLLFVGSIIGNLVSSEIEDEIKNALGNNYRLIIILLFLGLTIISGYFTWFQWWQQSNSENSKSLNLLNPVTLDEIRERLGKGGAINWIDRNTTDINQLRSGRVVITGKMKLGKTREALELIQKAIDSELIASNRIYKPNALFLSLSQEISSSQLNIELEHPILLFIDDLPYHYSRNKLKILEELLNKLKVCKDLFVIATARTDQISEEHKTWLDLQNFHIAEVPDLDEAQTGLFIDRASKVFNLQMENDARSIFINKRDGTPELILIGMRNLDNEGIKHVTEEVAQNIVEESTVTAWLETKRYIEKQRPHAKYLLRALAIFYSARLAPNTYLVLSYANEIWKEDKTGKQTWRSTNRLWQVLEYLRQFEIINRNGIISHSDFVAESNIEIGHAQNLLGAFLLKYRRLYRNPILRYFYQQPTAQAIALASLGNQAQNIEVYGDAEKYYEVAIKLFPHWAFYYNFGRLLIIINRSEDAVRIIKKGIKKNTSNFDALINLGVLLVELHRFNDAEDAFSKATHINSNNAVAWSNLGHVLLELGHPKESEAACTRATNLNQNFAQAYNNLGMALGAQERNEEAIVAFERAIEINPSYTKPYTNKAQILNRLGRHDEAIIASFANPQLQYFLSQTMKRDKKDD